MASIGASDDDIQKLSTLYWFTVEFGLCQQGDEVKAFGAGLLSSFGELEYALGLEPKRLPFDAAKVAETPYPITSYQPVYYVAPSFKEMKEQVREFAYGMSRPFTIRYNGLTESIEVLDTKDKIIRYSQQIRGELDRLITALGKN